MINALVGLPGHGKSYSAIELFILSVALEMKADPSKRRAIITNIPLQPKFFEDFPDVDIRSIDLTEMAKAENAHLWLEQPPSALFVLDELWRIWPSGLKTHTIPKEQLSFIKEHRHNIDESGLEPVIVLVTQDLGDIANAIRMMVDSTIICTKLTAVGASNTFRRDYYTGAVKGFLGPKSSFVRSDDMCKYKPDVYQYYKSHTKAVGNAQSINNKGVVNATIFNSWTFKAGVAGLVFLLFIVYWGYSSTRDGLKDMRRSKAIQKPVSNSVSTGSNSPVKPVVPVAPVGALESQKWRLTGHVKGGPMAKGNGYVLISDGRIVRKIAYDGNCKRRYEVVCEWNGELIASYTGSRSVSSQTKPSGFFKSVKGGA